MKKLMSLLNRGVFERMQGELKDSWESLDIAIVDVQESTSKLEDCRDLHDAAYRGLEDQRFGMLFVINSKTMIN